jgi:acetyl-CoA acetyltransferase family protein
MRAKKQRRVAIVAAARTPFCKAGGAFKDANAVDLGEVAARETLLAAGVRPERVDQLIFGIVSSPVSAPNVAREIGLASEIPTSVPAYTVSQACISANRAVTNAADQIALGRADVILAGGVETISDVPIQYGKSFRDALFKASKARSLQDRALAFRDVDPKDILPQAPAIAEFSSGETMGESAEKMAKAFSIAREDQDKFAANSHARAVAAWEAGKFEGRVLPTPTPRGKKVKMIVQDDHPRTDSTLEKLAKLKPVFDRKLGSVTAGNSSPLTDGASAVLLVAEEVATAEGWPVLGVLHAYEYAAVDPFEHLLMGPVAAIAKVLDASGLKLKDLGVIEMHEAFAAQVLCNIAGLGSTTYAREKLGRAHAVGDVDPDFVNQWGGSISLGHPFGATGGRLISMVLDQMHESDSQFGLVSACAAGGMGSAMLFELA